MNEEQLYQAIDELHKIGEELYALRRVLTYALVMKPSNDWYETEEEIRKKIVEDFV